MGSSITIMVIGVILMLVGLLLPIYTGNLFTLSKYAEQRYKEKITQGDRGWELDYKFGEWIRKFWFYIFIIGFLLTCIGVVIAYLHSSIT